MRNLKFTILFLICVLPEISWGQQLLEVSGEYIYYVPENVTLEQAKQIALDRLKVQLIADEFGTVIGNTSITRMETQNESSDIRTMSIDKKEVKGEWIETIGQPIYDIGYKDNLLYVKVSITGKIREIFSAMIDVKVKILRNGTEDRFENNEFKSGDEMFLSFQSPVDGYLTIYLYDGDDNVFCLLPYQSQDVGQVAVKANQSYTFFSCENSGGIPSTLVDEYVLTCSKTMELNRIYLIFSPNRFTRAVDNQGETLDVPRYLGFSDFQKWLSKCKLYDLEMILETRDIMITR